MSMRPELLEAARKAGAPDVPKSVEELENDDNLEPEPTKQGEGVKPEPSEPSDGDDDLSKFPEDYFGKNIKEYAEEHGVEAAETFYDALKDANRVANSRLQEIAELRKQAEEEARKTRVVEEAKPEEKKELTDEELFEANGLDPSLLQYDEMKPLTVVLRRQQAMEESMAASQQERQYTEWENNFFGTLDKLQSSEGKILDTDGNPVDNQTLQEFAIENNIYDADALYWRIMGPMRSQKTPTIADPERKQRKREISGVKRRRGTSGSSDQKPASTLAEHFENAKKELGVSGDPFAHEF